MVVNKIYEFFNLNQVVWLDNSLPDSPCQGTVWLRGHIVAMLLHVAVDGVCIYTAHVIKFRGDVCSSLETLLVIKSGVCILHRKQLRKWK